MLIKLGWVRVRNQKDSWQGITQISYLWNIIITIQWIFGRTRLYEHDAVCTYLCVKKLLAFEEKLPSHGFTNEGLLIEMRLGKKKFLKDPLTSCLIQMQWCVENRWNVYLSTFFSVSWKKLQKMRFLLNSSLSLWQVSKPTIMAAIVQLEFFKKQHFCNMEF